MSVCCSNLADLCSRSKKKSIINILPKNELEQQYGTSGLYLTGLWWLLFHTKINLGYNNIE